MKKHLSTIALLLVFFVGLSVMLYPVLSDWWNSRTQSALITEYEETVRAADQESFDGEFQAADNYNKAIRNVTKPLENYSTVPDYETILNVTGRGIMGYIVIPRIHVKLPIYHGTSEAVLNKAVGHLEGSSLPVGGVGNHAVLSAHRGLPSAELFSRLDELTEGDVFTIEVLNRTLTYEVDQILIVEPHEVEALGPVEGQDYCTLLTCTPYGINSHRLLVRGRRIENPDAEIRLLSEAIEMDPLLIAPAVAAPILLVLFVALMTRGRKRKE